MKALLDEQLTPLIAELLRKEGHDVQAVAERPDLVGQSDRVVFETASREDRAVVTNNIKDFRPLAAEWLAQGKAHAGLVLFPSSRTRTKDAIAGLVDRIQAVLRNHPGGLAGSERWIGRLPG